MCVELRDLEPIRAPVQSGSQVTMTVTHQAGDAYPITADPDLIDCKRVSPCGHFHRRRAGRYAHRWAHDRNHNYASFTDDCTNYISQALHAGGMWWMRNFEHGEGSWWSHKFYFNNRNVRTYWIDTTASWRLTTVLFNHLVDYKLARRVPDPRYARVGDLFFYDWGKEGDEWDHVDIVTGSDGTQPLLSGHGLDKRNAGFYTTVLNRAIDKKGPVLPLSWHWSAPHNRLNKHGWTFIIMRVTKQGANISK